MSVKIGYILRKFPVLSETFILNEMLELERLGVQLEIFSVERSNDSRFHQSLSRLRAEIHYIPDVLNWKSLLKHKREAQNQFGRSYRQTFYYLLRHFSPSLCLRFFQSCYVANMASRLNVDHFHAHFATRATTVAFFASKMSSIPFSFTAHAVDIFKESLSKKALAKKMEGAKKIVTVSEFNKKYLSQISPIQSEKITKIHNGIDLERFFPVEDASCARFTFLCVARMVEKKGHLVLLEACHLLKEWEVNFQCVFIGKGPLLEKIKKKIRELGLKKHVTVLGAQSQEEVLRYYHASHAFVLPCVEGADGNKDGLPVSIVEALACGLPIITTPMTGNPEVVKDCENGLLVPFSDSVATAKAMERLIKDREFYTQLQQKTRSSVVDAFDQEKTIQSLVKVFNNEILLLNP